MVWYLGDDQFACEPGGNDVGLTFTSIHLLYAKYVYGRRITPWSFWCYNEVLWVQVVETAVRIC